MRLSPSHRKAPLDRQALARDLFFALALVVLFWVGMNVPNLSQGMFLMSTALLLLVFNQTRADRIPGPVLFLLWSYLILHYLALFYYGFIRPFAMVKDPLFLAAAYKFGHCLGRGRMKRWPGDLLYVILAMVAGFAVFAFLSIYMAPNVSMYAVDEVGQAKAGRTGVMIWTGEAGGFGPILGIQGNLGTAFLPVLIFGGIGSLIRKTRTRMIFLGIAGFLILAGIYTNILLKNRGPFVIIMGITLILWAHALIFAPKTLTPAQVVRRALALGSLGLLVLAAGLVLALGMNLPGVSDFSHLGVVARFTEEGGSSPRTLFWINCIRIIGEHPLGGRMDFFGHEFAHNIWLDVGYDSGIPAMLCLAAFHIIHFKDMAVLALGQLPIHNAVVGAMIAMFCIIFISLFTEPVGKGYTIYFAMTFFYCGLLKRLTADGMALKQEMTREQHHPFHHAGRLRTRIHPA